MREPSARFRRRITKPNLKPESLRIHEELFNRTATGGERSQCQPENVAWCLRGYTRRNRRSVDGAYIRAFRAGDIALVTRTSLHLGVLLNCDDCHSTWLQWRLSGPAARRLSGLRVERLRVHVLAVRFNRYSAPYRLTYQLREGRCSGVRHWGCYSTDQSRVRRILALAACFRLRRYSTCGTYCRAPAGVDDGHVVDPDITHYPGQVLRYATPLGEAVSLDCFSAPDMHHFIEDVLVPHHAAGAPDDRLCSELPCNRFSSCQAADARSEVRAVTGRFARGGERLDWKRHLSGAGSREFRPRFARRGEHTSRSYRRPWDQCRGPDRSGPLFADRPHVVKFFSSYAIANRVNRPPICVCIAGHHGHGVATGRGRC